MERLMDIFGTKCLDHHFMGHLFAAPSGKKFVQTIVHPHVAGKINSLLFTSDYRGVVVNIARKDSFKVLFLQIKIYR